MTLPSSPESARTFLGRVLGCVLLSVLLVTALSPVRAHADTSPNRYKIGAYITAIHHIDTAAGTFDADLWVWSVGSSPTRDPLQTMEFVNSESITRRLQGTTPRGSLFWRQVKIVGTFRTEWDLRDFPFDRQVLDITMEEGVDDAAAVAYDPDVANTGYSPEASPPGWRIVGLAVQGGTDHYATDFGDPAGGGGSDYARLRLAVTLQRASVATFVSLAAPLYAAFLLCAVTFLLHQDGRASVEARVFLLASALFAVVVNMRTVSTMLGNAHHLTVVDRLHLVVLIDIVAATFVTVTAGIMRNAGKRMPQWCDYACCAVLVLSFVGINTVLITGAIRASSGA